MSWRPFLFTKTRSLSTVLVMRHFSVNLASRVRHRTYNGREYMVVPLSMIVSGVLSGNKGPLFYPIDEMVRSERLWDGVPITLGHPVRNGKPVSANAPDILTSTGLGVVRKPRVVGNRLRAEGWFEVENLKRINPDLLNALKGGTRIECSTGLITEDEPTPGMYRGRRYEAIARNYQPDHLAVLLAEQGACSLDDGCGVNVNADCGTGKGGFKPGNTCAAGGGFGVGLHGGAIEAPATVKAAKTPEEAEAAMAKAYGNTWREKGYEVFGMTGAWSSGRTQQLVAAVGARLREEWGIGTASIPTDRLREELKHAEGGMVTVKIPSRSEFQMSVDEAKAVLAAEHTSEVSMKRERQLAIRRRQAGRKTNVTTNEGVWRTIRGAKVFIEDGVITKGPKSLRGKSEGAATKGKGPQAPGKGRERKKKGMLEKHMARQEMMEKEPDKDLSESAKRKLGNLSMERDELNGMLKEEKDPETRAELEHELKRVADDEKSIRFRSAAYKAGFSADQVDDYLYQIEDLGEERKSYTPDRLVKDLREYVESLDEEPGGSTNAQPSDRADVSPDKACEILRDGSVHGHKLTTAQRGMFGAICGKRNRSSSKRPIRNRGCSCGGTHNTRRSRSMARNSKPQELTENQRQNLIDDIVANDDAWSNEDWETLDGLTDIQLQRIAANAVPDEDEEEDEAPPARNRKGKKGKKRNVAGDYPPSKTKGPPVDDADDEEEDEEKLNERLVNSLQRQPQTEEEFLAAAPSSIQEDLRYARNMKQAQKKELVQRLVANIKDDVELKKMGKYLLNKSVEELQRLVSLIPAPEPSRRTSYFGAAGTAPVTNELTDEERNDDILPLPQYHWNQWREEERQGKTA